MTAFEWDPAKDRANIEKHGVGFATAVLIFDGPVLSAIDDRFDYGEVRINSIGTAARIAVIVVTHTDRDGRVRIISARPAKKSERLRYEQALQQRTQS